jgi:hypothetical protein
MSPIGQNLLRGFKRLLDHEIRERGLLEFRSTGDYVFLKTPQAKLHLCFLQLGF